MGRPIEIEVDAKTSGAESGLGKVADGLDDVGDRLDQVGDGAKTSARTTERALDGIGDAAQDTARKADKLDRDLTQALDGISRESRRAGDDLGRNIQRGAQEADEGVDTLKENAGSNAKEIAASFDGSFEGMVDGIQGFVAEATEGFGAVGLLGGVGLAAAIGIGLNALTEAAEKANALTEEATGLSESIASAETASDAVAILRDRFNEVANEIGDARSIWEVWQPRAVTKAEQFADAIRLGSLNAVALTDAFNNPDPVARLEDLRSVVADLQRNITDAQDAQIGWNETTGVAEEVDSSLTRQLQNRIDVSKAAKDILDDEVATQEAANAILEAKAAALGKTVAEYREHTAALEDTNAAQEAFTAALAAAADPVSVYEGILAAKNDAEKAAAEATAAATKSTTDSWEDYAKAATISVDDLIAEWNRQAEAAAAFEANLAIIAANGGQAMADELRAKGPEVGAAAAAALAEAGGSRVQEAAEAYGRANGQRVGQGTASGITGQQSAVQGAVDGLHRGIRVPSLNMPIKADISDAEREIALFAGRARRTVVTISPRLGMEAV